MSSSSIENRPESFHEPHVLSDDYISQILAESCSDDSVSCSAGILDTFCHDLDSTEIQRSVLQDIDLYLECDDDGHNSVPSSNNSAFPHAVIGQNVHLRISFPNPGMDKRLLTTFHSCELCENKFEKQKNLFKHLKEIHQIAKSYKCDSCVYSAGSAKLLKKHTKRMHSCVRGTSLPVRPQTVEISCTSDCTIGEKKDDECNIDLTDLPAASSNPDEIAKMAEENDKQNVVLIDKFKTKQTVQDYIFLCQECSYTSASKKLLNIHFNTVHSVDRKSYSCQICDYKCKQKRTFDLHMKKHSGTSTEKCEECGKQFISIYALKRHQLTHASERPYACSLEDCHKAFKNSSALSDHVRKVHSSKLKLKESAMLGKVAHQNQSECTSRCICDWKGCGKVFRDMFNLKSHLCVHTGEKPRKCPQCDFCCVQKASLNWHIKKMHSQ